MMEKTGVTQKVSTKNLTTSTLATAEGKSRTGLDEHNQGRCYGPGGGDFCPDRV